MAMSNQFVQKAARNNAGPRKPMHMSYITEISEEPDQPTTDESSFPETNTSSATGPMQSPSSNFVQKVTRYNSMTGKVFTPQKVSHRPQVVQMTIQEVDEELEIPPQFSSQDDIPQPSQTSGSGKSAESSFVQKITRYNSMTGQLMQPQHKYVAPQRMDQIEESSFEAQIADQGTPGNAFGSMPSFVEESDDNVQEPVQVKSPVFQGTVIEEEEEDPEVVPRRKVSYTMHTLLELKPSRENFGDLFKASKTLVKDGTISSAEYLALKQLIVMKDKRIVSISKEYAKSKHEPNLEAGLLQILREISIRSA